MRILIIFSLFGLLFFNQVSASGNATESPSKGKAVLVTGASSGIGLNIAKRLASNGFYVYAGARKPQDIERLSAMDNISGIRLDVTKDEDIKAAYQTIKAHPRGLYGIVNNAGVGVFGPVSEATIEDIQWVHDVNVLGPHRINQAFLPLLKASNGRTFIIGSISGFLTGANFGSYSMSKFAVEAYAESLFDDLKSAGVHSGIVEPGPFRSKIREKFTLFNLTGSYQLDQKLTPEQQTVLAKAKANNDKLPEPDAVSAAVLHGLTSDSPQLRYMVTPDARSADITIEAALRRVVQLNANQPHTWSRARLVETLDKLIEQHQQ